MPLRADLLNPIPGDNPGGINLRYDPVTDKIKEARREDLDVPQGEWKTAIKTADWNQVIKLSSDALAKKGKDLQLAVWLVDAHIRKEGFPIIAPCFEFLNNLIDQFWDTLHPEIEDADVEVRAAPLAWLGSKLEEPLKALPITANKLNYSLYQESRIVGSEADANTPEKQEVRQTRIKEGKLTVEEFDEAVDQTPTSFYLDCWNGLKAGLPALEALSDNCDLRFGEFTPSFIRTRTTLEDLLETTEKILRQKGGFPEQEAEVAEEEPEPAYAPRAMAAAAPEPSPALTWDELNESTGGTPAESDDRDSIIREVAAISRKLRARDPEDPAGYMLIRTLRWAELEMNAPLIKRDVLEAPPTSVRVGIKRQAADQDWEKVLDTTETCMTLASGPTWLDLQRYTAQALSSAGYSAAARCLTTALRGLLTNIPDLVDLTLPDDTPAANQETKTWLENMVMEKVYKYVPKAPGSEDDSSSSGFGDSSMDTPADTSMDFSTDSSSSSLDMPSMDMSTDTSSTDTSMDFSMDLSSSLDTSSTDTSSTDFNFDMGGSGSSAATAAAPAMELPPIDEDPPIIDDEPIAIKEGTPDIFDEAIEAVKAGNTADGLGIIFKILATERTGRGRFKRRSQLAHLLIAGGKEKVAQPILDELASEIEGRKLEDWEESEALAYPLALLLRCLASDGDKERKTQLYARICKLDPVRALNCSP